MRASVGAAMKVHSTLGPGFLESMYQNVLIWALQKLGLKVDFQKPISVQYASQIVGLFTADLLLNELLIVELNANQLLAKPHEVQLIASGINEALLPNFAAERLVQENFWLPKQSTSLCEFIL